MSHPADPGVPERRPAPDPLPAIAALAALLVLLLPAIGAAALALPALLLPLTAAVALRGRRRAGLRAGLGLVALGLAAGLGGAWVLRLDPVIGAVWTLAAVGLVLVPVVPWLYSRSFDREGS